MRTTLVCDVAPRLDVVSPTEWQNLFPDLLDSLEMVRCVQGCGIPGFTFHSIVVREMQRPILLLPLFETDYRLSTLVEAGAQRVVERITNYLPQLNHLHLLGVGFVEGEWGQVGSDPQTDRATLNEAWDLALTALEALARGLRADLTAFVNFTTQSGRMLPMRKLTAFEQIAGLPIAQTRVTYADTHEYLASLSKKMRSNVRRYLRKAHDVTLLRTRQPGPWLDAVYQLYLDTYRRSKVNFSMHSRDFFKSVCQRVDGAQYTLYFIGERLVAFGLHVVRPDCLIDQYFGMDQVLGREYSLFFVSWFKDLEYCMTNRIPLYHAGPTEEETKARLGSQFVPSRILFRHRQPLVHGILTEFARHLAYQPSGALPPVRLGSDWDAPFTAAPVVHGAPARGQASTVSTRASAAGETAESRELEWVENASTEQTAR